MSSMDLASIDATQFFTRQSRKLELFGSDVVARQLGAVVDRGPKAVAAWQNHALVIVKPEGIFFRRADAILEYILRSGYLPVCGAVVQIHRPRADAMWKYVLNAATPERRQLAFDLLDASPSIVLLWRRIAGGRAELPATVELSSLKGSSDPANRAGDTLRSAIHTPNRVLSCVHVSDEPLDVLRELLQLLPPVQFAEFEVATRNELHRGRADAIVAWARHVADRLPAAAAHHRRLDAELRASEWPSTLRPWRHLGESRRADGNLTLSEGALRSIVGPLDAWSQVILRAYLGRHDQPEVGKLLPDSGYAAWCERHEYRLEMTA